MDFQDLSTDDLVQLVRNGQAACYNHIVKRYQLDVMKKANLLLLGRPAVEDVVQDVFFRAFTHLDQYTLGTSFRSWLMGIAQNSLLQELRRSKRYEGRLSKYASEVEAKLRGHDEEQDEERAAALLECISRLEASLAGIVQARYVQQTSIDEIAGATGRTSGSIRTLLYRARARLRVCLEHKGVWR